MFIEVLSRGTFAHLTTQPVLPVPSPSAGLGHVIQDPRPEPDWMRFWESNKGEVPTSPLFPFDEDFWSRCAYMPGSEGSGVCSGATVPAGCASMLAPVLPVRV